MMIDLSYVFMIINSLNNADITITFLNTEVRRFFIKNLNTTLVILIKTTDPKRRLKWVVFDYHLLFFI